MVTIPTDQSGRIVPLTSGLYVVLSILQWDQDKNIVFYTANTENDPNEQHVYAVRNQAGAKPQCLTCDIEINGKKQTFFSASFSLNGNHLMLVTDGPNIPKVDLYSWHETDGGKYKIFVMKNTNIFEHFFSNFKLLVLNGIEIGKVIQSFMSFWNRKLHQV